MAHARIFFPFIWRKDNSLVEDNIGIIAIEDAHDFNRK
jgi:hypothetical protein